MGRIMLITKENCDKCDWVKERIPEGLKDTLEIFDYNDVEVTPFLAYYEKIQDNQPMPILIVDDEELALDSTIKIKNKMIELNGGKK